MFLKKIHSLRHCCNLASKTIKGLIVPVVKVDDKIQLPKNDNESMGKINEMITKHFDSGPALKKNEVRIFWDMMDEYPAVCAVGIGDINLAKKNDHLEMRNIENEIFRNAAGLASAALMEHGITNVILDQFPNVEHAVLGAKLSMWQYQEFKEESRQLSVPQCNVLSDSHKDSLDRGIIKADAQNFARLLMSKPSNYCTPKIFSEIVDKELSGEEHVKITVHEKKWIEEQKMGAFLSVSKGSPDISPIFMEVHYKNGKSDQKPYVLIGDGIISDSGGACKSTESNKIMDLNNISGAACVVSVIKAISGLKLPVNVIGLMPLTHSMPTGTGDIVIAHNGKSIAVTNTDAAGTLVLADALSYSKEFNPEWIIDVASLTGSVQAALGSSAAGAFANSHKFFNEILQAACMTGDRLWRLPLWNYYSEMITNTTCSDIENSISNMDGGACTAAAFLHEFVPDGVDWVHLDIAGVARKSSSCCISENTATGRPVCTLVQLLENLSKKSE